MYRTGDLARYLPDGAIEFLGRIDQQVKVRGFRVELEEIDAVLAQHPVVRECVVLAREDVPGDKRLVAYLVPAVEDRGLKIEDSDPGASEILSSILHPLSSDLRAFLKEKLPDYMVPSAFMVLDALPLTINGKVDRTVLPAPDQARPELASAYAEPETATEQELAAIWAEVLRVAQVGRHDNFFALGGHSLLTIQVLTRIQVQFGVELPVREFFTAPTIKDLAEKVEQAVLAQLSPAEIDGLLDELDDVDEETARMMLAGDSAFDEADPGPEHGGRR